MLFIIGGLLLLAVGVLLFRRSDARAWLLGAAVMTGMLVAGVLSRTTGLPGFLEKE